MVKCFCRTKMGQRFINVLGIFFIKLGKCLANQILVHTCDTLNTKYEIATTVPKITHIRSDEANDSSNALVQTSLWHMYVYSVVPRYFSVFE